MISDAFREPPLRGQYYILNKSRNLFFDKLPAGPNTTADIDSKWMNDVYCILQN